MSWFTYYRTAESKDGLRPSVRRSIDRFVPLDNISEGQWLSVDVSGLGINQVLDSTLQTVTSNYSYKVVYHDENVDGNYVVVDSVVDDDGRIYFKAAENHAVGEQISKRYYIYYRDNNLAQIVYDSQSQKYTLLGSPLAQTYILNEYEVQNNFGGHYSFSFLNSDLDWSNGYSEKIGATATLLFSGPNITLYGNTGPDYGAIKITITPIVNESNIEYEQRIEQFVDLYSQSEVKNVPLYSNTNLNYRDYLIKIEVLRKQNVKSTSSKVYISKASFLFLIKAKVSDEQLYEEASFNFLKISNSKKFTLQNLKPGKNYILTVKAKNSDINVGSNYFKTVMFSVPDDNTVPAVPENLTLYASFLSVMFKFDFVSDLDISKYEYELYKENQITKIGLDEYEINGSQTPYLSGFNPSNIFTVAVDENTTSDGTDETPVPYYGRIRSIDTTGNISEWTDIVKSGDTPLIDEQFIGSLTAARISAGTIGAHKITLGGANSIIQSSSYGSSGGENGWFIGGDGHFSIGGPDGISYNNESITIGSDVQVQANLAADSISVGSGVNSLLNINDSINNGGGGMTLGDPSYNYWYADGKFRAGNATRYIEWDNNNLKVSGELVLAGGSLSSFEITSDGLQTAGYQDGSTASGQTRVVGASGITSSTITTTGAMKIFNYGDVIIQSSPTAGPHIGQYTQTEIVGEYINIQDAQNSSFNSWKTNYFFAGTLGNNSSGILGTDEYKTVVRSGRFAAITLANDNGSLIEAHDYTDGGEWAEVEIQAYNKLARTNLTYLQVYGDYSSNHYQIASQAQSDKAYTSWEVNDPGTTTIRSKVEISTESGGIVYIGDNKASNVAIYTERNTAKKGTVFTGNTDKVYFYFNETLNSNDPGYIMHETRGTTEINNGVLHLSPSDDNAFGDYVSIHGTNDAEKIRLHTNGQIDGVTTITAEHFYSTDDAQIGDNTEYVYVNSDSDNQLQLVSNTDAGRPYISFYNKNADGALVRKAYIGYADAKSSGGAGLNIYPDVGIINMGKTNFTSGTDVEAATADSGYIFIGNKSGSHIAIDNNEIHAKGSGTTSATLYLNNNGGTVRVGSGILELGTSNVKDLFYGGSTNNSGKRIFIQSSQPSGSNGDIWIKP
jgi:hypothetical protein